MMCECALLLRVVVHQVGVCGRGECGRRGVRCGPLLCGRRIVDHSVVVRRRSVLSGGVERTDAVSDRPVLPEQHVSVADRLSCIVVLRRAGLVSAVGLVLCGLLLPGELVGVDAGGVSDRVVLSSGIVECERVRRGRVLRVDWIERVERQVQRGLLLRVERVVADSAGV